MDTTDDAPRRTTCLVCGGPAYRSSIRIVPTDQAPWLHLDTDDWHDNPHNVQPDPERTS